MGDGKGLASERQVIRLGGKGGRKRGGGKVMALD